MGGFLLEVMSKLRLESEQELSKRQRENRKKERQVGRVGRDSGRTNGPLESGATSSDMGHSSNFIPPLWSEKALVLEMCSETEIVSLSQLTLCFWIHHCFGN